MSDRTVQDNHETVAAVVVTYNRKELLTECLTAILGQTVSVDKIILIDNASTDGTPELLAEKGFLSEPVLHYVRMDNNVGGAGGFREGLWLTGESCFDWIWMMDDDTIPEPDCLEKLLDARDFLCGQKKTEGEEISFLASAVYGPGGESMNVPVLDEERRGSDYPDWYRYLEKGLVRVRSATFVSILVNGRAVQRCGLPCADFYIWGDDKEYTRRLTTYGGSAWMVGASHAIHKRALGRPLHIRYETDPARIPQYRYLFRNRGIVAHYYHGKEWEQPGLILFVDIVTAFRVLRSPYGWRKFRTVLQGVVQSVTQYPRFRDEIDGQMR